jgi:hypothetical protein
MEEEEAAVRQGDEVVGAREEKTAAAEPSPAGTAAPRPKPFQVMQFLVRDYASFEQDIGDTIVRASRIHVYQYGEI